MSPMAKQKIKNAAIPDTLMVDFVSSVLAMEVLSSRHLITARLLDEPSRDRPSWVFQRTAIMPTDDQLVINTLSHRHYKQLAFANNFVRRVFPRAELSSLLSFHSFSSRARTSSALAMPFCAQLERDSPT